MELSFLYSIPRNPALDSFFLAVTKITGSYGQLWLIVAVLLLAFKKTRRAGVAVLISYAAVLLFGQLLLKHLVSRLRPCEVDPAFALLVSRPTGSSFPSTHSAWAFGGATAILLYFRKAGAAACVCALLIAFSRLYLFLHFPTDVLFGIAMGMAIGVASGKLSELLFRKLQKQE